MTKVLVYGNFQSVHLGHLRFFEYAKSLGNSLIVAINADGKGESDIKFSESVIGSFPFPLNIVRYTNLEDCLRKLKPDIVVRGREFKDKSDLDNKLIVSLGIRLMFGSGNTHLSEDDFRTDNQIEFPLRESFKLYAESRGFSLESLKNTVKKFAEKNVTVIGDLLVDEFINCKPIGMSQEDPIVVSTPISSTRFMGGAGIVAAHCKALGAKVNFVSLTGDDELATWAQNYMDEVGVETRLIRDSNRPTVVKQRFKSANQTLFRLTHFRSEEADKALMEKLIESTLSLVDKSNILIFSDFVFGTLHPYVVSKINEVARNNGNIFIAADSQSSSQVGALFKFREIDLVTPTEHEARLELRNEVDGVAVLTQQIARELNANSVILKLGADGVLLGGFINGREVSTTEAIPSANLQAIDPSGAGDSLLAASTLAMSCAQNLQESAFLGSLAAGIQVSRRGNIPIKVSDFENVIGRIFL